MAVINFGSINIDHVYKVEHFVSPGETLSSLSYETVLGGKGANQSIACAKAGASVKHVGNIHQNDQRFLTQMSEADVNCEHVRLLQDIASGHAIIQVNDEGENAIVLFAGANHQITQTQINSALSACHSEDWVLLQNETNAIDEIIDSASKLGLQVAFNPAPMTDQVSQLDLDKLTLLIVNEVEAMQMTKTSNIEDACQALSLRYPNTEVLLTLGKAGVRFLVAGDTIEVPSFEVDVIDTTAAGDTFIGYFLAQYSKGQSRQNITTTLCKASAAAALCVSKAGAAPSIPTKQDVELFLSKQ